MLIRAGIGRDRAATRPAGHLIVPRCGNQITATAWYGSRHSGSELRRCDWQGACFVKGQPPRDHVCVANKSCKAAAGARIGAELGKRKRDELLGRLRPHFARTAVFLQASAYLLALMSSLPSRNGWSIAEFTGDKPPGKTRRLLNRASWSAFAAMSEVRKFAAEGLDEAARKRRRRRGRIRAGALDETGQEKKGENTARGKRPSMGRSERG